MPWQTIEKEQATLSFQLYIFPFTYPRANLTVIQKHLPLCARCSHSAKMDQKPFAQKGDVP